MKDKIHIEYKMHYMYDTLTIDGKEIVTADDQTVIDAEEMLEYIAHALNEHITIDMEYTDNGFTEEN